MLLNIKWYDLYFLFYLTAWWIWGVFKHQISLYIWNKFILVLVSTCKQHELFSNVLLSIFTCNCIMHTSMCPSVISCFVNYVVLCHFVFILKFLLVIWNTDVHFGKLAHTLKIFWPFSFPLPPSPLSFLHPASDLLPHFSRCAF